METDLSDQIADTWLASIKVSEMTTEDLQSTLDQMLELCRKNMLAWNKYGSHIDSIRMTIGSRKVKAMAEQELRSQQRERERERPKPSVSPHLGNPLFGSF